MKCNLPVKEAEVWTKSTLAIWWQKLQHKFPCNINRTLSHDYDNQFTSLPWQFLAGLPKEWSATYQSRKQKYGLSPPLPSGDRNLNGSDKKCLRSVLTSPSWAALMQRSASAVPETRQEPMGRFINQHFSSRNGLSAYGSVQCRNMGSYFIPLGHGTYFLPTRQFWDSGGVKLESLCNFSIVGCQWTVNCLLGL